MSTKTVEDSLRQALAHAEKLGSTFNQSAAYWRAYYAGGPDGAEPIGAERLRVFREALTSVRAEGLWLEAGCGIGMMTRHCRGAGLRVCGIDMSEALLEEAQHVTGLRLVALGETPPPEEHLCRASVERTPYEDESFDGAYSSSVLEYVDSLELALAELRRVVRHGGYLIFNLPNAFSVFRMWHALRRRRHRYYSLVPRWAYWNWEINRMLKRSGWRTAELSYYGAERNAPGLPSFVPTRLRAPLARLPWAASFVLIVARKI